MGWRTIKISSTCKLDLKSNYLAIRQMNDVVRVQIDEIDTLIVETTAVSLTVALLVELAQKKVNVIFCDGGHNPSVVVHALYGSHDTSYKVREQIKWKVDTKDKVWKSIIEHKIMHQKEVLKHFDIVQEKALEEYQNSVEIGDITNREGHAAKVYFNALFGNDFSRKDDVVENACLNYGYSIILSMVNREIVKNGCLTQIGIHHDNKFNQFNLGCDLMEPIRALIDYIVYKNKWEKIDTDVKREICKITAFKVTIAGQRQYLTNAVSIYCKSVIDALNSNDESLINHIDYELQNYENNCAV